MSNKKIHAVVVVIFRSEKEQLRPDDRLITYYLSIIKKRNKRDLF
jgi:hypothetical protein